MIFDKFPLEKQLDTTDCGPACLKMIARFYGKYYSLQYLRDLCGNTREGVSLAGISYAAEQIGFRSFAAHCTIDELLHKIPFPVIIHWDSSHFVVLYDVQRKRNTTIKFYIADPERGNMVLDRQSFETKWLKASTGKATGVTLLLEMQADFKYRYEGERKTKNRLLSQLINYFKPYKRSFYYLALVMLIITAIQALFPFISKAVIDVGIRTQDLNFINIVLIANLVLIVSLTFSSAVRDWILQHMASRINIALISDYLIKLMRLPPSFFENKMLGDILQRANDHERIRGFIMNNSLNLVFSTLTFAVFTVVLLIYNTTIFNMFLIGSILYVIWVLCFFNIRKKLDWDYFELTAKNQSFWVETISGITDIKVNNYEQAKRWKWEAIQARLFRVNLRLLNINNIQNLGATFIDSVKNLLITFFCARAVIGGDITFGVMISTQFIIGMLNGPVQQLISFIISFQFAQISFARLNEVQELKNEDADSGTDDLKLAKDTDIILNNVSFQYTHVSPIILKNISIHIPQGKVTAIVGDSGSGKTTLLKLLLRLYEPTYGSIEVGGMNLNNISLRQWRDHCGSVLQDGKIFNDTVLSNIILGDTKPNSQQLKNAVAAANIEHEIEKLPLGYQTKLGEDGRSLSGGQKQRVLIARALYKNPSILFFDEATNSLDTINEHKITSALEQIFNDKTVVVVAHRLSTIRKAFQIIVMQDGRVVEVGNHDLLMQRRGRYHQLVASQTEMNIIAN